MGGYRAISLASGAQVQGGINNTGRLQGDSAGIRVGAGSSISGGLTNSGQIIGATYHGISLFGVLTGGLQNTGTVFGTAATGVYLANGATLVGNLR